jgi:hypothetical protein
LAEPPVGDEGDSGEGGGTIVAEGLTELEVSSSNDAHPERTMQAAASAAASMDEEMRFMGFVFIFSSRRVAWIYGKFRFIPYARTIPGDNTPGKESSAIHS